MLTNYPFNKAHRILLLSFPEKTLSFPLLNGSVDWENVKDSVTLNDDEIDSLSNILFNVGCRANKIVKNISTAVGVDIAIIFIGSSNDLVDYIEICFGCGEVDLYVSKRSKTIGITCNQKLNKLKQFSQACALRL